MEKVKEFIETFQDALERKQILYSRLISLGGRDPYQEESIYERLEAIEEKEELILVMMFESNSLSCKESAILNLRSEGNSLAAIGDFFSLSRERIRQSLENCYNRLSDEFEEDLSRFS